VQALPQLPQLLGSVLVFTHVEPHNVCPVLQPFVAAVTMQAFAEFDHSA
jgi:hypothetical protein